MLAADVPALEAWEKRETYINDGQMSEGGQMKTIIMVAAIVFLAVGWLVTVIRSGDQIEHLKGGVDVYRQNYENARDELKTTLTQLQADEIMLRDPHFLTVGFCSECRHPIYSKNLNVYLCDGCEKPANGYCDEFKAKIDEVPEYLNHIINLSEVTAK